MRTSGCSGRRAKRSKLRPYKGTVRSRELWPALGDELHGFGGEAVEGCDAEFEVLFFCVFDFVVADATERLHEHHYVGIPARETSAASWSGPDGMR